MLVGTHSKRTQEGCLICSLQHFCLQIALITNYEFVQKLSKNYFGGG